MNGIFISKATVQGKNTVLHNYCTCTSTSFMLANLNQEIDHNSFIDRQINCPDVHPHRQ